MERTVAGSEPKKTRGRYKPPAYATRDMATIPPHVERLCRLCHKPTIGDGLCNECKWENGAPLPEPYFDNERR